VSSNLEDTPRERLAANLKTPYSADEKYWSALLDAFAAEIEELERVRAQVRAAKFVDTADAASLERLATRFELERKTDEPLPEFRARVKVALRSQLSSASLSEIREVVTVLLDIEREAVRLREPDDKPAYLNARLSADVVGESDVSPASLNDSLLQTTAAGVGVKATLVAEPLEVTLRLGSTEISEMYEAPTLEAALDLSDTQAETINSEDTFGVDRFDGEDTFS